MENCVPTDAIKVDFWDCLKLFPGTPRESSKNVLKIAYIGVHCIDPLSIRYLAIRGIQVLDMSQFFGMRSDRSFNIPVYALPRFNRISVSATTAKPLILLNVFPMGSQIGIFAGNDSCPLKFSLQHRVHPMIKKIDSSSSNLTE